MNKKELIEICGYKIQAHRRCVLNNRLFECRYSCSGINGECLDYTPVKVPKEHWLVYTNMEEKNGN